MSKWQIEKNVLDLEYQRILQEYQVVFSAVYAVPLALLGVFTTVGATLNYLVIGMITAFFTYLWLSDKKMRIEKELSKVKQKVDKIKTK